MRRADQALVHRRGSLDGEQFVHQGRIDTTAKLGQRLWEDKMDLRAVHVDLDNATGIHDGKIGA
jgi:hypothetical protein